jgi:hypothetical protein
MSYIENPKTKGSGILCAIPQGPESLPCPRGCSDCFFQGGRSYLEPLAENLPNLPDPEAVRNFVVRVNDGLDSGWIDPWTLQNLFSTYSNIFFNTSYNWRYDNFPYVRTINPGKYTDKGFFKIEKPGKNLMFVRFRANIWNRHLLDQAIEYYTSKNVPVVITFMAYFNDSDIVKTINEEYTAYYTFKKRTLNSYWCINQAGWNILVNKHKNNPLVSTCGRDANHHMCRDCGVCLREYWATKARLSCE